MNKTAQTIFEWSEVWALFIPLFVLVSGNKQSKVLKPIVVYLFLALILNLFSDVIGDYKFIFHLPLWLQSNNPVYNIHSLVRFICFSYFFISLPQPQFKIFKRTIPLIFLLFVVIEFIFFEDFFLFDHLSGNLLSVEAFLLLVYCMLYYLGVLNEDDDSVAKGPFFWIVTGLSIYVIINFFVFLFFVPLMTQNPILANHMWTIHNVAYIIFCLFIAKAFYATT
jgi:hypothetical protein